MKCFSIIGAGKGIARSNYCWGKLSLHVKIEAEKLPFTREAIVRSVKTTTSPSYWERNNGFRVRIESIDQIYYETE